DTQRGSGYYDRTLAGCKIAQDAGLRVRFICTFTKLSFERKEEIFNFFMENGMPLKLHPALPSIRSSEPEKYALPPEKYGELLVYLLDKAILNIDRAEILNINDLCRCVFTRQGNVCTYADCMGTTFAIGPDGSIYPCYRFVGMENYVMGNVYDSPSWDDLKESRAWKLMFEFKDFVDAHCADCRHISYCRGGCPYNAIALTDGVVRDVDPHCPAYKRIFDEISDRLDSEIYGDDSFDSGSSRRRRRKTAGVNDLIRKIISQN
ncbi:MAG: TIGR04083 family peptide-modifying radical SAM enzyme, partial [Methanomicrobium sp.]|nr:TIGR04083 family peptide-modifying radical SAM enzyme [Methanomicrobium sp.]